MYILNLFCILKRLISYIYVRIWLVYGCFRENEKSRQHSCRVGVIKFSYMKSLFYPNQVNMKFYSLLWEPMILIIKSFIAIQSKEIKKNLLLLYFFKTFLKTKLDLLVYQLSNQFMFSKAIKLVWEQGIYPMDSQFFVNFING